jgi:hypothetical protein
MADGTSCRSGPTTSSPARRGASSQFIVDTTRPATAPTVTSTDYPADGVEHGGPGIPGTFTFSANGDKDVVGFRYGT